MNAKTMRLLKEARPLFWPWCAVTISSVLPLVWPSHWIDISQIGFFAGIPLLATLSFGNEFQHRTLSLLLTQPVDRMEIWAEKLSVTFVAVLSAALVWFLLGRVDAFQPVHWQESLVIGACIIALIASAPFWTLVARSTLLSVALNFGVPEIFIAVAWFYLPGRIRDNLSPANMTVVSVATFALLCYAGVMLWLGRRTLAQFQEAGGMAGDDLMMAGPSLMPGALADWFRCRATGAFLNLIRKELRLLRPLWMFTVLAVLAWTWLTTGLLPGRESTYAARVLLAVSTALGLGQGKIMTADLLLAVLAGSLSLGEERTSGTHLWHMTLPVSARRLWLIKLLMALFAGSVCAVLLPTLVLIAVGSLSGSPFRFVDLHASMYFLLAMSLLSFASFWCACAVKGTVRSALWVFPALGGLSLASAFGKWVPKQLMPRIVSRFDFFSGFRFTNSVSNFPFFDLDEKPILVAALFLVPILLVAVIQSYRLFRKQDQEGKLPLVRNLLPLATMAFLLIFSGNASIMFVEQARQQMWTLFSETHQAIEMVLPGAVVLDAAHPLQITVDDLAQASPLSERTRRWLRNSRISFAPDKLHPGPCCHPGIASGMKFAPDKTYLGYSATIHMASGPDCTLSFHAGSGAGILRGVCQ